MEEVDSVVAVDLVVVVSSVFIGLVFGIEFEGFVVVFEVFKVTEGKEEDRCKEFPVEELLKTESESVSELERA